MKEIEGFLNDLQFPNIELKSIQKISISKEYNVSKLNFQDNLIKIKTFLIKKFFGIILFK